MAEKVLFTRSVDLVPMRKGIYKDPMKDINGFRLLVWPTKETTTSEDGVEKACKPQRRRKWGEDPEYDRVMRNFGCTPGAPGEEVEQQIVFGWANVTVQEDGTTPFDHQGDIIDTDVLESAVYNYVLAHGLANQEHECDTECGWLVESMMFTKEKMAAMGIPEGTLPEGWFVGFYIPDPDVFKKVKNGEYNMFSIEGYARRIPLPGSYDGLTVEGEAT